MCWHARRFMPPGGLAHTRYLCKRLRACLPNARIVVGRWGLKGKVEENQEHLRDAGADQIETTLLETRTHLHAWLPVLDQVAATTKGMTCRVERPTTTTQVSPQLLEAAARD